MYFVPSLKMLPTSIPLRRMTGRAAVGAGVALAGVGDVGDDVRRVVAGHVDVAQVEAGLVGAGDEVGRPCRQLVDDDDRVVRADRRPVAGLHARAP